MKTKKSTTTTAKRPVGRPRLTPEVRWERRVQKAERLVYVQQKRAATLETPYEVGRLLVARRALHSLYAEGFAAGFLT